VAVSSRASSTIPAGKGKAPVKGSGRKSGARSYGEKERIYLLQLTQKLAPIGGDGWQKLTDAYNQKAEKEGWQSREKDNLRHKFNTVRHSSGYANNKLSSKPDCFIRQKCKETDR
jgi:hypothetical protein